MANFNIFILTVVLSLPFTSMAQLSFGDPDVTVIEIDESASENDSKSLSRALFFSSILPGGGGILSQSKI